MAISEGTIRLTTYWLGRNRCAIPPTTPPEVEVPIDIITISYYENVNTLCFVQYFPCPLIDPWPRGFLNLTRPHPTLPLMKCWAMPPAQTESFNSNFRFKRRSIPGHLSRELSSRWHSAPCSYLHDIVKAG